MQREFSKELAEDRDFEIGKEIFTWRYPHWKETAQLYDDRTRALVANGDGEDEEISFSYVADAEMAIKQIPMFLEGGAATKKRWEALVNRKEDAVPRHQIVQLYRWLIQVTAEVPTTPPSSLGDGGGDTDISSQGESS